MRIGSIPSIKPITTFTSKDCVISITTNKN